MTTSRRNLVRLAAAVAAAALAPLSPAALAQPAGAKLALANAGVLYGDTAHFRATLTAGANAPVPGTPVDFFVDGAKVGHASTGADGVARLDWDLPDGIKAGAHPTAAEVVPPAAARVAVRAAASLDVIRAQLDMWTDVEQPRFDDVKTAKTYAVQVYASLREKAGKRRWVKGEVEITFNGVKKTLTTNATNVVPFVSFTVGPADYGKTGKTQVSFDGDGRYLPTTSTPPAITLMTPASAAPDYVYAIDPKIHEPIRLGTKTYVLVTLTTPGGAALPNVTVTGWGDNVDAPGFSSYPRHVEFGNATTGPDGRAHLDFAYDAPLVPGGFILHAAVVVNGERMTTKHKPAYQGSLLIDTTPVDVAVTVPPATAPGGTAAVKVHLSRATDHKPATGAVRIYDGTPNGLNGTIVGQQTTSAGGDVTISVPVPANAPHGPRPYTVMLMYAQGDPFTASNKAFTLNVAAPGRL